jgi:class 3 adenylate cyclase
MQHMHERAADVAGYSRLMGADEEGTHERLKAHLGELVNPKIGVHRGRIVKNTGDGFLAEFPSVVDAVRCATEIQRGMADREPHVPDERRIRFRMGINLGDVIVENDSEKLSDHHVGNAEGAHQDTEAECPEFFAGCVVRPKPLEREKV